MWVFLSAGIVYLLGVAVVLFVKPTLMFSPDGQWKEFGIGQREDRYSPFPFWLFCLTWAIVSYVVVVLVSNTQQKRKVKRIEYDNDDGMYNFDQDVNELPKGYYVLNKKATRLSGIPKYVFLGANEPSA